MSSIQKSKNTLSKLEQKIIPKPNVISVIFFDKEGNYLIPADVVLNRSGVLIVPLPCSEEAWEEEVLKASL